ncbi:MAG: SEL1-like repeat protein [Firmicutes bacterium]|nr:SEL1-like repeat protein [Bacillota bacterium]
MRKPTVTIAVLGNTGHGKSTLVAAISKILSKKYKLSDPVPLNKIDEGEETKVRGIRINTCSVECEIEDRIYRFIDCPSHTDWIKSLITGEVRPDGAILVGEANGGFGPQLMEQIIVLSQVGTPFVTIFINKCDLVNDEEFLDLADYESREVTSACGFDGDNCEVIRGSALKAFTGNERCYTDSILKLKAALDDIPAHEEKDEELLPFLMAAEDIFAITGKGIVVTGKVERGCVRIGDILEIVGLGSESRIVTVSGIQMLRDTVTEAKPGDNIGLLFHGLSRDDIQRGQVLARPGSIPSLKSFSARIYVLTPEEGGHRTPMLDGSLASFYFRTTDVNGVYRLPADSSMVMPGSSVEISVELLSPLAMKDYDHFYIRENNRISAVGVVFGLSSRDPVMQYAAVKLNKTVDHSGETETRSVTEQVNAETKMSVKPVKAETKPVTTLKEPPELQEVTEEKSELESAKKQEKKSGQTRNRKPNPDRERKAEAEKLVKKGNNSYSKEDYEKAFEYYLKAAELGDRIGQKYVGYMYREGIGTEKDNDKAFNWTLKSAEQGESVAQTRLALMYEDGRGTPQEFNKAFEWFVKAAKNGNEIGMFRVGWAYWEGKVVEKNDAEALRWFEKAANNGHKYKEAAYMVGYMYHCGYGTKKSIKTAKFWYKYASALGYEKATKALKIIRWPWNW